MDGIELRCPACDRRFDPGRRRCPDHDHPPALDIHYNSVTLRDQFDPTARTRSDLWRYRPLLPVTETDPVTLGEGRTPLVSAPAAGGELGVALSLKLDGSNPTGSAKDRGSAVVATAARETGHETVACASTGNAAASIAAYAARGDLDCSIFVPEELPDAKATQPMVYDASVCTVDGSYGDAYDRCRAAVADRDWVDRSAGATPYAPAGTRTLGFELAEEAVPDWIAVPIGNGGTIAGVYRGWQLYTEMGYAPEPPRFLGVQAAGAPAVYDAVEGKNGGETTETCADSIAVDQPHRLDDAAAAIEETGGRIVTVSDESIREAIRLLGRTEGIFAEPASAAAVAGIEAARERGQVDAGESVVALVTGTGLKDTATAADAIEFSD